MDFQRRYGYVILGLLIFSSFMARNSGATSPLSFISKPIYPLCRLMLNHKAQGLFYGSLQQFLHYLRW